MSVLGRFEARASSVRPLAPPAGRVLQAWQRHPGATQLFYPSTPPRYARQSSCSSIHVEEEAHYENEGSEREYTGTGDTKTKSREEKGSASTLLSVT